MTVIADLIEFENENSNLDFKTIQYKKEIYEMFLKDIMSMANSISKDDKYIIIGVKHFPNGHRDLIGIQEPFVDDATYQQIVDANIEPLLNFRYFPFEHNGKLFGIFQISDCSNPPYMMKKKYGNLKLGDAFIRKGSFQNRLTRKDIDIQNQLILDNDISSDINLSMDENLIMESKTFEKKLIELPSSQKRKEIQIAIDKKEKDNHGLNDITIRDFDPFTFVPYEKRSISELKKDLENVESDYLESDCHCVFEQNAYKLNFFIHNNSTSFLDDVSVIIAVEKDNKFIICEKIYKRPSSLHPLRRRKPRMSTYDEMNYPSVELTGNRYIIRAQIDKVKHKLPTEIFKVPIRVSIPGDDKEIRLKFNIKLFAKNIKSPILSTLEMIV